MLNWGSIISTGWLTLFARGKKKWWDKCKDWLSQMRFFADENAELVLQGHPPKIWKKSKLLLSKWEFFADKNAELVLQAFTGSSTTNCKNK